MLINNEYIMDIIKNMFTGASNTYKEISESLRGEGGIWILEWYKRLSGSWREWKPISILKTDSAEIFL